MSTLSRLFPQARKLQYELKSQLHFLESGRGGTDENQLSARQNLSQLQQIVTQMENSILGEPAKDRDMWKKRIQQLREESNYIGSSLEQYLYRLNRNAIEAQERESLLSRRSGAMEATSQAMYGTQEYESLKRSSDMVTDLSSLSNAVLSNLGDQGSSLKNAHRKVLDIANRLGLSNSLLRVIERRDVVDKWIVYGGMAVVLVFFYICVTYLRG